MKSLNCFVLGLALLLFGLTGCANHQPAAAAFVQPFVPVEATAQNQAMAAGVNVLGYDPIWRYPDAGRFKPEYFRMLHEAGFGTVRVVLQSFEFLDADGRLDPKWLGVLDRMVNAALDQGLTVILDEHDFNRCSDDPAACRVKLKQFWSVIAPHFRNAPNRVLFELLNEPHGSVSDEEWNGMLAETLALVRQTNPERNIVIGPGHWNGLGSLDALRLPEADRHIVVTFHYYTPMTFTHQGAAWASPQLGALSNVAWGSDAEYALLNADMDAVKAWSVKHGRPVFLGEFGVYDKAPMAYRTKWLDAVARAAEARGFSWAYWQFDADFVLYDFQYQRFVEPVLHALIRK
jgi:endoglucanase